MPSKTRIPTLDIVRGLVMVFMALDHTRDYFGDLRLPTPLAKASAPLFFTRWITHFCAPVFVLLAGTSAWLYGSKRSRGELSRFLLERGLWLIVLEFTVVHLAWFQTYQAGLWLLQVIAAIGLSMIALSALIWLPQRWQLGVGLLVLGGHNMLDTVSPADLGSVSWLWKVAHQPGLQKLPGDQLLYVVYPVLPWTAIMLLGYTLGPVMAMRQSARRLRLAQLGTCLCLGFVVLRSTNLYGDSRSWTGGLFGFLDCTKYPPSLLFSLMTLGPALLLLAALDREPGRLGRGLLVFGQVPLFYYVVHLYLLSSGSRLFYRLAYGQDFRVFADGMVSGKLPEWYGHPLWVTYAFWILSLALLYPLCRWFGERKRAGQSRLWSFF